MCINELNKEQEEAANFLDGVCAVIAVPGSGKTLVMMRRIGNLVSKHGIAPENILGLTFTRNSSEEMRNRLTPILEGMAGRVMLSTIHGFCYHLLRQEGYVFEILSGKEQIIFIRNIIKKLRKMFSGILCTPERLSCGTSCTTKFTSAPLIQGISTSDSPIVSHHRNPFKFRKAIKVSSILHMTSI